MTKDSDGIDRGKLSKKPYTKPALEIYGDLSEITGAHLTRGKEDHSGTSTNKSTP
jgi:hypothetical protein